ncbi:MAG: hypothetical protein IPM55_16415 [Acidobacteria bacterium]|nr:hypothetical protein [Acidobacteriota bacterium]
MLIKLSIPLFVLYCLLCTSIVLAQNEKAPLKNADIIEMLKAELPESTIILAIQQSPSNFDTSAQGLIQLKKEGASPKILEAILKSSEKSQTSGTEEPDKPAPGGPSGADNESGFLEIFLLDGTVIGQCKCKREHLESFWWF